MSSIHTETVGGVAGTPSEPANFRISCNPTRDTIVGSNELDAASGKTISYQMPNMNIEVSKVPAKR